MIAAERLDHAGGAGDARPVPGRSDAAEINQAGSGRARSGQGCAMAVRRLTLTDFRNYASLRLDLQAAPVALIGPNGAGKTNLLEAVSLLTPGRGLRRAKISDMDRRRTEAPGDGSFPAGGSDAGGWGVSAEVDSIVGPVKIGTGREPGGERRSVRINGAPSSAQALSGYLGAVWVTPQMNQIFLESAGNRRRFLDRLIFATDPAHAGRVSSYEQAMRDRARLLKDRGANGADKTWLSALESQMAERGVAVAAARLDMADRLGQVAKDGFGPFPGAMVTVEGEVETWLRERPALAAEDAFRDSLAAGRMQDAVTGGAAVGPHRCDLRVRHLAKDMAADQCSTGEQKALLMALVLAHARLLSAERGAVPLLLLDEVAAHLDEVRRAALFEAIVEFGTQAWLTGTDASVFAPMAGTAQAFRVVDACLQVERL
ncbi:DNA replication/repair protein RecF [Hwanghaeella sp.]|uniref:DNA replication/repair protein RecF n=1 Tax=Hwanghaeella sp. TaxID=2605943 RepID=UPI003CCB9230